MFGGIWCNIDVLHALLMKYEDQVCLMVYTCRVVKQVDECESRCFVFFCYLNTSTVTAFKSLSHSVRLLNYICSSVYVCLLFWVSLHRSQTFSGASLHVPKQRKGCASKTHLKQLKQQIAWSWCHTRLHAGEDTSKLFYCVANHNATNADERYSAAFVVFFTNRLINRHILLK